MNLLAFVPDDPFARILGYDSCVSPFFQDIVTERSLKLVSTRSIFSKLMIGFGFVG